MEFRSEKIRAISTPAGSSEQHSRTRQQSALADLSQRALQSKDLPALFEDAVALVAESLQVRFCDLLEYLPEQAAFLVRAAIGWREGYLDAGPILVTRNHRLATVCSHNAAWWLTTFKPIRPTDHLERTSITV